VERSEALLISLLCFSLHSPLVFFEHPVMGSVRTISMLFVQSISESSLHLNQSGKRKNAKSSQAKSYGTKIELGWTART
jgi:hypothetical protein